MTVTTNAVEIAATPERIYALASHTERWPEWLPHYRGVDVLGTSGATRTVRMRARHDGIPIAWKADQTNDPVRPWIGFRHVRGWTRGMDVEWRFEPLAEGKTRVVIEHRLEFRWPRRLGRAWLERVVVSGYFVHGVASKTLARFKALAEAGA